MAGFSAYLDVPTLLRAPVNQETASLLGLNTALSAAVAAGALSLTVASSAGWVAGPVWLLDGPSSEVAQVTGAVDVTHLTLAAPGVQLAHGAGVALSQAGAAGSLAEVIMRASGWIEGYCRQGTSATDRSLFALARTEQWGLPGLHAALDRDGVVIVCPGHFPVQSVTGLTLTLPDGTTLALGAASARIVAGGRMVEAPLASALPGWPAALTSLRGRAYLSLTYSGGISPGVTPFDVQQACVWVTCELLAQRRNPTGAALVRQGKFEVQARPRLDVTGDSVLMLQAKAALEPYRAK
ncbi:MAG TPA: hypothetical protein VF807_02445 [Ktedonobacterales bacterium]